jgi:rare lipoprotein A
MRGALAKVVGVCALAGLAAACSTAPASAPDYPSVGLPSGNGVYKIGEPYAEKGVEYVPHEQPDYDETGIASWYGYNFHHKRTANGEIFDAEGLTAAHPTLPMPVNVRVTNLDNGHSLVLRVNDRGPFANGRIIDVSAHAAKLLGFYEQGTANVRVTYLSRADLPAAPAAAATAIAAAPTESLQMAALDPTATAPAARVESDYADAPPPQSAPSDSQSDTLAAIPLPAAEHIWVQAGTFSVEDNAERLKDRLSQLGDVTISSIDREGRVLYRVRIGPFDDVGAADAALARLNGLGTSDAKVIAEQ